MRKLIFIVLILTFSVAAYAQGSGIGVGFSTSGLTGKYWLSGTKAIGLELGRVIDVDYLINDPEMLKLTDAVTPIYYGLGLGLRTGTDDDGKDKLDIGLHGIIGIAYYLPSLPMDIFLDTKIGVGTGGLYPNGTFGFRYFF